MILRLSHLDFFNKKESNLEINQRNARQGGHLTSRNISFTEEEATTSGLNRKPYGNDLDLIEELDEPVPVVPDPTTRAQVESELDKSKANRIQTVPKKISQQQKYSFENPTRTKNEPTPVLPNPTLRAQVESELDKVKANRIPTVPKKIPQPPQTVSFEELTIRKNSVKAIVKAVQAVSQKPAKQKNAKESIPPEVFEEKFEKGPRPFQK